MKLFLTIDLEDWYTAHDYAIPKERWDACESRIEKSAKQLLELLAKYDVKAIFFVLGYIADRHPELIQEIVRQGHIIASHGYWHEKLYELSKDELKRDIHRSLQTLEKITGAKIKYYRAPSWTYDFRTQYLHELLMEEGITVDSSLQPFVTPLSGVANAPLTPFYPLVGGKPGTVLEFPVPVFQMGFLKIPFCGGFYFRVMPYWFFDKFLKSVLKKKNCFVYIHPWELDAEQPKQKVSLLISIIHNYGIKGTKHKLEKVLKNYQFSNPEEFGEGIDQ